MGLSCLWKSSDEAGLTVAFVRFDLWSLRLAELVGLLLLRRAFESFASAPLFEHTEQIVIVVEVVSGPGL